jgi:hypothetical protein
MHVPLPDQGKVTHEPFLILECYDFKAMGAFGETPWGRPRHLDAEEDLKEWRIALNKDGGDAYVIHHSLLLLVNSQSDLSIGIS